MRNYPEWVVSYWATLSVGAAVVAMNSWWTGPELEFALRDSSPAVAILDGERLERLTPGSGDRPLIVARHDGDLPPGATHWRAVADAAGAPDDLPPADIAPDDDACIFYTSGTTGPPKGARTTHRGSTHNLINLAFIRVCGDMARDRRPAGLRSGASPAGRSDTHGTAADTAVPCHRKHLCAPPCDRCRWAARSDAPLGRRRGSAAHRTGTRHQLHRRTHDGARGCCDTPRGPTPTRPP